MPKPKAEEIKDWPSYLKRHCDSVSKDDAEMYAKKGQQFLKKISTNELENLPGKSQSENMAYLHWYLLKTSFDEGKHFSKGTFNLRLDSNEQTNNLYNYLKGDAKNLYKNKFLGTVWEFTKGLFQFGFDKHQPYSRTSTHYNKQLNKPEDGHYGVDNNKEIVPLAWNFKTHAFGLTQPKEGGALSLYIKPETEGANLKNTWQTIKHFFNLIKAKISPEKIEDMSQSYRESAVDHAVKTEAVNLFKATQPEPDGKMLKKFNNELKKCKSIPDIRNLLDKKLGENTDLKLKFDDHIESTYGTKNQTGGEIRFAFHKEKLESELQLKIGEMANKSLKELFNNLPPSTERRNSVTESVSKQKNLDDTNDLILNIENKSTEDEDTENEYQNVMKI